MSDVKIKWKSYRCRKYWFSIKRVALQHEQEEKDVALELSNFQLLGIDTFAPEVSVVCNLAPDHLDYMPSLDSYYASKMRIYENCKENDWFLRNVDDETVMQYAKNIPCPINSSFTRQDVDLYRKDKAVWLWDIPLFNESDVKIVGDYNLMNAMVAQYMAYKLGVSPENIAHTLQNFHGVEHRLEYVGEKDGVRFYNGRSNQYTCCTGSIKIHLKKILFCLQEDMIKGFPFDELSVFDKKIKCCISFGETKEKFKDIFTNTITTETMKEALKEAIQIAQSGDVVLLSLACGGLGTSIKTMKLGERLLKNL